MGMLQVRERLSAVGFRANNRNIYIHICIVYYTLLLKQISSGSENSLRKYNSANFMIYELFKICHTHVNV